jgi:UDP-glucose 4-epimerase
VSGGIVVTGAGSFIAAALIARLRARGIWVGGFDLVPPQGEEFHAADINDPELADLLPQNADAVVHLAALSRDADCRGQGHKCFAANVVGSLNVARAALARGARQFIFASTEWVYDDPDRPDGCDESLAIDASRLTAEYALSKYTAELALRQQLQQTSCALTILRFGIVYGERQANWGAVESLLHQVATEDAITVGARATARRYLHVDDVAAGIHAAVGRGAGETVNIQGPRLVSLGEVIDCSAELLGRNPVVTELAADRPSIRRISSDKAERVLDWHADIDIATGLDRLARYFGYLQPATKEAALG